MVKQTAKLADVRKLGTVIRKFSVMFYILIIAENFEDTFTLYPLNYEM
jgi:hypothetical protein